MMIQVAQAPGPTGRSRGLWERGLLGLLLAALPLAGRAQAPTPTWQAVFNGGNALANGSSAAQATATDASGNVVIAGFFSGQLQLGATILTSRGSNDMFVAQWQAGTATWAWARSGGGTSNDNATGVAVDGSGNVVVTGYVNNAATSASDRSSSPAYAVQFDGVSLPSASASTTPNEDVFVARYSSSGTYQWAVSGGGTSFDRGTAVAVDGSGNVLVTGYVNNAATSASDLTSRPAQAVQFGGVGLNSASASTSTNSDVFVAKYSSSGVYQWASSGGGTGIDQGYGVAVDGSGNVLLTGSVTSAATSASDRTNTQAVQFGGVGLPSASASTSANADVFVARYSSSGAYQWAASGGGTGSDQGAAVAVDGSGNALLTGYVTNAATSASDLTSQPAQAVQFGGTGLNSASASTINNLDVFVAKYSSSGAYQWARSGGGTSTDRGYGVAVDGSGNVYLTGTVNNAATSATNLASAASRAVQFGSTGLPSASASTSANTDVFVARYSSSGAYQWATSGGSLVDDSQYAVAVDGSGSVYAALATSSAGSRYGSTLGPVTVAGLGRLDAATGSWQRADFGVQYTNSVAQATATDASGNVYVTGIFFGQLAFGATLLQSAGSYDVFVAKWQVSTSTWAWAVRGGGSDYDGGTGLAVDGSGSVYVTGYVTNAATSASDRSSHPAYAVQFGGTGLPSASASTSANADVFVAKYSSSGAYQWAQSGGGTGFDQGLGLALDGSSNVLVTGSVTNAATSAGDLTSRPAQAVQFGGTSLNSASTNTGANTDVFVTKYSSAGTYQWATSGGGTNSDQGTGVAVDASGSVVVTGFVTNAATSASDLTSRPGYAVKFGGVSLNSASATTNPNQDVFVVKYDASGSYQWAVSGGGMQNDAGTGVAVNGSGDVLLTGYVYNAATSASDWTSNPSVAVQFGGVALPSASASTISNNDVFVAKYSGSGVYQWAASGGGRSVDQSTSLAVDGSGNAVVTGYVQHSATSASDPTSTQAVQFGGAAVPGVSTSSSQDLFVVSYSTSGAYQWASSGGGAGHDRGLALALDGSGVITIVGQGVPQLAFGSQTLSQPAGSTGLLLARLLPPALTLTALSVAAELPGQPVVLTGTGLGSVSAVRFGGVSATFVVNSPTSLTATVPVGAAAGPSVVSVSTSSATVSLPATAFEVLQVYRSAAASGCLSTAPLTLSGAGGPGAWRYLRLPGAGGAVVAAIEDTRNLGSVTAGVNALGTATAAAVRQDGRASRAYLDRNFYLTATTPSFAGQTVRVRFFGLSSELVRLTAVDAGATLATLNASQYDGANVDCALADNDPGAERRLLPAPATVLSGADWFTAQVSVADHFSEFYLTGASSPLPVELLGFTATAEGPTVRLAWTTASEQHSARFEVERSAKGEAFAKLGEVAAQGTTARSTAYTYLDARAPAGTVYYRLRQVDLDGTAAYSPVRAVLLGGQAAFSLYPNPAHGAATATGLPAGAPVLVLDALGRPVARATADAAGTARLVLPAGLAAGVYIVRSGAQAQRLAVE